MANFYLSYSGTDIQTLLDKLDAIDFTVEVPYGGTTTNVGNDYSIATPDITALAVGMAICVKINVDSSGATTLNWDGKGAKSILKANGGAVSNLKAGGIYTLRYDGTNFIIQGEGGSGDAVASDLLSGKTASTDAGDITGTMPNKVGSATEITPSTVDQVIPQGYYGGITGDGKVFGDADLIPANIAEGVTIFGVEGTLALATLTGDAVITEVLSGKTFYSDSTSKLTGTMSNATLGTAMTPGTTDQAIAAGYHAGTGNDKVLGDADLVSANIKSGITIFGVAGNANVVDTSTGDAVAADILATKKAWVDGVEVTGSMVDCGTVNITPSTSNQSITAGKHSGSGVVYGDGDLVAGNIKSGVNIFGVAGSYFPSPIVSVQYFSITMTSTTGTATISSVTVANSLVLFMGNTGGSDPNDILAYLTLTDSTTVTATRIGVDSSNIVMGCVIEFASGVISQRQSGVISIGSASLSATATITAVTISKTLLIFAGRATGATTGDSPADTFTRLELTNTTTITGYVASVGETHVLGWNLVQFI